MAGTLRLRLDAARILRVGVVVALVAITLAGCVAEPALPSGVTVQLVQLRSDVSSRQAEVRIDNGSDSALTVGAVRVEDARFADAGTRVIEGRTSTVPAGAEVDLRVQLPAMDCDAPDEGESTVTLTLASGDVSAAAPDALGFLARLHAEECLRERLADAATLEITGFTASDSPDPGQLEMTITPTGAGGAEITGMQRTNLLDLVGQGVDGTLALDVELKEGDADPVVVAVPIIPGRCDPHAVQEDKRGTVFPVKVAIGADTGRIDLFGGEEMRGRILAWVSRWCGSAG